MRKAIIGVALLLLMAVPASADDIIYNFLQQGYSFIEGTTPGDQAGAVGLFEPLQPENPPFDFDYVGTEVTWVLQGMTLANYTEVSVFQNFQFTGGTIGVYEDASFDLDYGNSPAEGIASATNGTAALTGTISSATILFNTLTEVGTFNGYCNFDGGSRLGELGDLAMLEWQIFDGMSADVSVQVPPGYHSRLAGRIFTAETVATESTSISKIRALY
jgi:hypothetical protein